MRPRCSCRRALGEQRALLLVNHGIVVVGDDLQEAVVRSVLLEDACRQQLLVQALGGARRWSSDEEARAKQRTLWSPASLRAMWDYLVRRLDAT
jgi:ribulose-5-phosphate 4-epimerase/fuculose-1-phosphate aldolase